MIIDLKGKWTVKQTKNSQHFTGSIAATVPGCIHTDLISAKAIPDPFYRDKENNLQWISRSDWQYSRTFDVPVGLLQHDKVILRCEGLDTLATVSVNGKCLGKTDNMYRTWEWDISKVLKAGKNQIEILFSSTVPYLQQRHKRRPIPSWLDNTEVKGRSWIRKEPCNYGWDWGPTLITCGIWRPIKIVAIDKARLTGVHVRQNHSNGKVELSVAPETEKLSSENITANITVSYKDKVVAESEIEICSRKPAVLSIPDPQLWWPNNMGKQPLYTVKTELFDLNGKSLGSISKKIGLRTLRLDRHPDKWGETFQFVVNGVPFFAKGGNWIPADSFSTRITQDKYSDLLTSVAKANMNMVRLWGGGIYEADDFYELCDELGICVWHDFMFACSTYPTFDRSFMKNVEAEFKDNVRRIRHHSCIAFWCGNNELEQGLTDDKWTKSAMSWKDYGKLFDKLLPETLKKVDPDRDYWPGSPHTPGKNRKDYNDPTRGDAHLWDVWHGRKPFEWYRTCEHRFNSEFGFQSFPEPKTVYSYTKPEDRNVTSRIMEHHQRSGIGNTVIMQYMLDWFLLPSSFENTLWLSQVLQGMAMKYAVEHWRRSMPRGMGTLYWQINDCWPVASWASIDYFGRWKALHYMAKNFNNPLLVSNVEDANGNVEINITSDLMAKTSGRIRWKLMDVDGKTIASGSKSVNVKPLCNNKICTLNFSKEVSRYGKENLIFDVQLSEKGRIVSSNISLFCRPKHLNLRKPKIACRIKRKSESEYIVELSSKVPALWTWLELKKDVKLSDNFFHLIPGSKKQVVIRGKISPNDIKRGLVIRSLTDTY